MDETLFRWAMISSSFAFGVGLIGLLLAIMPNKHTGKAYNRCFDFNLAIGASSILDMIFGICSLFCYHSPDEPFLATAIAMAILPIVTFLIITTRLIWEFAYNNPEYESQEKDNALVRTETMEYGRRYPNGVEEYARRTRVTPDMSSVLIDAIRNRFDSKERI